MTDKNTPYKRLDESIIEKETEGPNVETQSAIILESQGTVQQEEDEKATLVDRGKRT